ncbi:uncharacterized protein LOC116930310 isoform X2 [Daphnia magna]|uniref:uncharacterized protein LOC116930310 isoform X2 n=1 Tax=Daphnia magna TaxID=35525 RepID=UPI001E1BBAB6|nr:uncharacterized protein LOC116930310 isoform X2 [Daphnia magna]XP_045035025.1 uncharacterized protein LOC116930310 isoform X2 [Daphnia magna]
MEMVRAFTTRLPVVGATGTTLQRNITIYVLVAGIAGGLLLILAILLLCKYCSRLRSRTNRGENTANPVVSGWGTEVSVALTSGGISKVQHRLTSGNNNNKSSTASNATGTVLTTTLSPVSSSPAPLASSTAGHQHLTNIGSSASISPSPIIKDDLSDSYVIQVEPIRVMATSPSSIMGGADSWASDESPTTHRGLLTVNEELDGWSRRIHQQSVEESVTAGTNDSLSVSPVVSKSTESHRRSLRHAATHDDGSANSSAVSKRRLDWRNSHRNYRSAPTAAASRDSYALNYDTRRALRNYHQRSIEAASAYPATPANRRVLHKRGGSMREPLTDSLDASRSSSTAAVVELTSAGSCLASTGVAQQQHPRCQMMASPATKRWRCHTVDCPCSNNVTASAVNKDLILVDGSLTAHRHSFPSSGDLLASPSSSSSNRRRNYQQHRSEDQHRRTKESLYDGYLNRSESLDWAGFQTRNKAMTSTKRDEPTSVITDIDGTGSQLQSSSAGQVPRITIRYNDPGSLESVNEDNLFFCLEAGSKNEFRQRLEKTIDAQYRQVWELRANLEEHNGFYEPSSPEPEAIANNVTSDVESFDSNSESLASEEEEIRTRNTYALNPPNQDVSATCETKLQSPTTMLHPPMSSGSWKRQSYRSVSMNSRLPRQTGPISPLQKSPQQHPQSSFDSIDTIETSSTEPSRMDQVTTSFESSATDSTNGLEVTSIQPSVSHHRMLALRNDSGYRSLESAVVPVSGSTKTATNARISLSEDDLIDPQSTDAACQCKSQVLHDEMCERQKPIVFARCTRYGMKVRSASTSAPHSSSQSLGWKHQQRLHQHHSHQSLTRDYSIDERTDALFREFSRCDPVFDSSCMKNVGGGSRPELQTTGLGHRSRWINQHQRHDAQHHYQHRFISSDASESLLQHCSLKE